MPIWKVTLITQARKPLLAYLHRGEIAIPTPAGEMVLRVWDELCDKTPRLKTLRRGVYPESFSITLQFDGMENALRSLLYQFQRMTAREYHQYAASDYRSVLWQRRAVLELGEGFQPFAQQNVEN